MVFTCVLRLPFSAEPTWRGLANADDRTPLYNGGLFAKLRTCGHGGAQQRASPATGSRWRVVGTTAGTDNASAATRGLIRLDCDRFKCRRMRWAAPNARVDFLRLGLVNPRRGDQLYLPKPQPLGNRDPRPDFSRRGLCQNIWQGVTARRSAKSPRASYSPCM